MQVIPCGDDPELTKFLLPGWHRVIDDIGQSLAFFRHQAEADAFLLHHGYSDRMTKGRQMAAMLTAHSAVSLDMARRTANAIIGYTGVRYDQNQQGRNTVIVFLFDDGSEFTFNPE